MTWSRARAAQTAYAHRATLVHIYCMGQRKPHDFSERQYPPFSRRWEHFSKIGLHGSNYNTIPDGTTEADVWLTPKQPKTFVQEFSVRSVDTGKLFHICIGFFYTNWLYTVLIQNWQFSNSHNFIKKLVWHTFYISFCIHWADASFAPGFRTCW
jgi:hypothetical protein